MSGHMKKRRWRGRGTARGWSPGIPAYPPWGTARSICRFDLFQRAPRISTSSAVRSPDPWNQQTSRSPLGSPRSRTNGCAILLRKDQLAGVSRLRGRDNRQPGEDQQDGEDSGAWMVIIEVRRRLGTRGSGLGARVRLGLLRMLFRAPSPESRAPGLSLTGHLCGISVASPRMSRGRSTHMNTSTL